MTKGVFWFFWAAGQEEFRLNFVMEHFSLDHLR